MHWWEPNTKFLDQISAKSNTYRHALVGTLTQNIFLRFSANSNTYRYAMVRPYHKTFSPIFSYK